jgi:HSP20 family protein
MSVLRFEPYSDPLAEVQRMAGRLVGGDPAPRALPMDVWRSGDAFHVALDAPGVDPGSIDVTCERNTLTVTAERRPSFAEDDSVLVAERGQGRFSRQLVLGEGLDTERIDASYEDGVLHLTIPVAPSAEPRRIDVRQPRRDGPQAGGVAGGGAEGGDDRGLTTSPGSSVPPGAQDDQRPRTEGTAPSGQSDN